MYTSGNLNIFNVHYINYTSNLTGNLRAYILALSSGTVVLGWKSTSKVNQLEPNGLNSTKSQGPNPPLGAKIGCY